MYVSIRLAILFVSHIRKFTSALLSNISIHCRAYLILHCLHIPKSWFSGCGTTVNLPLEAGCTINTFFVDIPLKID